MKKTNKYCRHVVCQKGRW